MHPLFIPPLPLIFNQSHSEFRVRLLRDSVDYPIDEGKFKIADLFRWDFQNQPVFFLVLCDLSNFLGLTLAQTPYCFDSKEWIQVLVDLVPQILDAKSILICFDFLMWFLTNEFHYLFN